MNLSHVDCHVLESDRYMYNQDCHDCYEFSAPQSGKTAVERYPETQTMTRLFIKKNCS